MGGKKLDTSAADAAFKLQQEQLALQKKQLAEMELKEKGAAAAKQSKLDELLKRKKTGRASTLLTGGDGVIEETTGSKALF